MLETKVYLKQFERSFLEVDCGSFTYGKPKLELANSDLPRKLTIGRYSSIARDCIIFVGRQGRHPLSTLSTYPLGALLPKEVTQSEKYLKVGYENKNLDVHIGSDVWIGVRVTIMAGVTIGHGAVIAAGSVVTKNVDPYAVVGGVPAKVIKMRHPKNIVDRLLASKWWDLDPIPLYESTEGKFNSDNIEMVIGLLEKNRRNVI